MNFVDSLNLFGVEAKQIPTIILHGVPSESTEGAVGVLGMDVDSNNNDLYKCVAARDGVYTWKPVGGGSSASNVAKTVTLSVDGWYERSEYDGIIYELEFPGVTADPTKTHIIYSLPPVDEMEDEAARRRVRLAKQEDGYLLFKAKEAPTIDIDMNILVVSV